MQAMKFLVAALVLFLSLPAHAQSNAPPEARAFPEGATSFEQLRKKKEEVRPNAKTPDKRQPNVEIWLPPEFQSSEQKWPLLIFSHGFGGCAKQSDSLMRYLADQGYIVAAPDHEDANCRGRMAMSRGKRDWPERPFRTPEVWTDKTEADRKDDVLFAVSSLLDDRRYKNYVDTRRMGLIGHSLGGYTVLGVAGAWPAWKDKRFKAVLAFAPYLTPYLKTGGLKRLGVPVMYQGGTDDKTITPDLRRSGGAYAHTPAPKYFIELDGAGHEAWTALQTKHQTIIDKTAVQFLDRYVKGDEGVVILPEGQDKPGRPVNKVKTFWMEEGDESP